VSTRSSKPLAHGASSSNSALSRPASSRPKAAEALRGLIDALVLTPGELGIELQGNLAAMLKAAQPQSTAAPIAPLGILGR
jgi:hypothetical protein